MTVGYRDLSRDRCLALLGQTPVGRLAYCAGGGPRIYPLNFALHGETVVFRTAAYTALGTEIDGQQVAFEVDEVDPNNGHGWSVVVSGQAEVVSDPSEIGELRRVAEPQPWAPGVRSLYVRIAARRITGRAVGAI